MDPGQNGRVAFTASPSAGGPPPPNFPGYTFQQTSEPEFQNDMLRGNMEASEISRTFFSGVNLERIQRAVRKEVFEKSQPKGYIIDNQSVDELKMIMRAIYLTYCRNQPFNIAGQVEELNRRVIAWSVPHVLSAVDHYMYYLDDISHLPVPESRSVNVSRAGTRSKPFVSFM